MSLYEPGDSSGRVSLGVLGLLYLAAPHCTEAVAGEEA